MMFGKVLRPAGFNARLISADTSAAEQIDGVKVVRDGDFIAVVAPDSWSAEQALSAIKTEWDVPPQISNQELFAYLRSHPESEKNDGSPKQEVRPQPAAADISLEALVHGGVHCACASRASRGCCRVGGRKAHRMDGDAAALRGAR